MTGVPFQPLLAIKLDIGAYDNFLSHERVPAWIFQTGFFFRFNIFHDSAE
jgi:hypothetical protein